MTTTSAPPLLGDPSCGCFRIHIVGNSGSGKSTLAAELAALLGVPHVALDALFWEPGWRATPPAAFRAKVRAALDAAPRGWVVDGSYTRRIGSVVQDAATDIIWLDPPLARYLPRLVARTAARLFGLAQPCSAGCAERWRKVFCSRESIVWWCITQHGPVRRRERSLLAAEGVHVGGRRRRIGGWGGELAAWKESVRQMVRER